jgi:NAD(P)-dependent dehydrogenase (short-subunit alcohol dehydrogenase family)
VVTGGGRGIGRAIALALAGRGHPVCVDDTGVALDGSSPDPGPAESVAAEIVAAGGTAMASVIDARSRPAAEKLVSEVETWSGRPPTVLVHSAGTLGDAMVHKASDDSVSEVLDSHLGVALQLTRAMAGPIRSGRFGRILYVGGAAGLVGSAGQAAYAAAKAGLFGLTRAVALEMAGRDVCVNYLVPFAFTRMTESIPPVTDALRAYLESAPLATPDDIAAVAVWLCSTAATGLTGQVVGARGAAVTLWSQPRPVLELVEPKGWDPAALATTAQPAMQARLTPLESEFDLFGGPPHAVGDVPVGHVAGQEAS